MGAQPVKKNGSPPSGLPCRLSKKSKDFSDSLQKCRYFPPLCGGKVLAALAERLALQGIQGIRSHSRRAAAPSSSPANTRADSSEQKFFDKLNGSPLSGLSVAVR